MEKKIQDYIKYYIGCEVIGKYCDEERKGYLTGVQNGGHECEIQFFEEDGFNVFEDPEFNETKDVKLSLFRLEDMTEEDKQAIGYESYQMLRNKEGDLALPSKSKSCMWAARQTHYLLSKGYDLFNLIPEGLAIDKKTFS